ncbi:fibronectin type III domain-containing protein [Deinococcus sp. HMF7604]|uniref:fibronectin type III domain-containing protein n=1 Tax=Deinococcus betulae TaxID=2873312 RepID=UPI001CC99BB5|nr:fibronectin type III domain-containing protein [Deinococcus betulae]MBZ9750268.1 fibronectin type III domain-containing protein [Deinococcus betulae]
MKRLQLWLAAGLLGVLAACSGPAPTPSTSPQAALRGQGVGAPASGRLLLIGQSSKNTYTDWQKVGQEAAGGSVYYELRSADFNKGNLGGSLVNLHREFADFLATRGGKYVQVGVSWKDNPPGYNGGDENLKASISRGVTQSLANRDAGLLAKFDPLIAYINSRPGTKFLLRLDYEVSPFYHCEDYQATGSALKCLAYKGAFNSIASYVAGKVTGDNVGFIYHPVRGVFREMYPGAAWVDWIGLSVFNHELCLPIYNRYVTNNGTSIVNNTIYNGEVGRSYDTAAKQCINYVRASNGSAVKANFDLDANVLAMMKFARDNGKPMILSETAPMNFAAGQQASGAESESDMSLWVNRLFRLVSYNGPLPEYLGVAGNVDLSGVVKAVVYMNTDLRYGWDGYYGQTYSVTDTDNSQGGFRYDEDWYNNAQLDKYTQTRTAFCTGLANTGFGTRCGGGGGGDTAAPTTPGTLNSPAKTSSSVSLTWGASTDNVGVARYEVLRGGTLVGTPTGTSFTVTGLAASTAYSFQVRAVDAAGNGSGLTAPLSVTTSAGSSTVNIPGTVTTSAGSIASGTTRNFEVNATQNAKYKFLVTSTSSQNSQLVTVAFNGESVQQAISAGQTITVYFQAVTSGPKTLSLRADSSAVSLGRVEGQTW